jgi:hypothetical protein
MRQHECVERRASRIFAIICNGEKVEMAMPTRQLLFCPISEISYLLNVNTVWIETSRGSCKPKGNRFRWPKTVFQNILLD